MRTVRILDLRRGHLRPEFVPKLRVESFHKSDSEGCTIVTIERHSPIVPIDFRPVLYICALHARAGWLPPESSCSIEPITVCLLHQESPRFGSRLKFWRTTTACIWQSLRRHRRIEKVVSRYCVVQIMVVQEPDLRRRAEYYMLSVLRPKYCD